MIESGRALRAVWIYLLAAGCTSYAPQLELWPTPDSSPNSAGSGASNPPLGVDAGQRAGAGSGSSGNPSGTGTSSSGSSGAPTSGVSSGSDAGAPSSSGQSSGNGNGGGGAPPDAGSVPSSGACSVSVTVTTLTDHGAYSPRNIGAVWIAQPSGTFVKTLAAWARNEIQSLTLWNSATAAAGLRRNTVDAITSATLSTHQTHSVSWNCTNATKSVVPDGPYRVYFEMTDDNVTGPSMFVDFTKGAMPLTLSPPDAPYFKGIKLVFTP